MAEQLFQYKKSEEYCPQCGEILQIKRGKKGLFLGCSAFPQCDFIKPLQAHSEVKVLKDLEESCPQCAAKLQIKSGQFGLFIGCSAYPECDFVVHEEVEQAPQSFPCPECQRGELVARRGRNGKTFYGCNQFPHCKFTLAGEPQAVECPNCGAKLASLKKSNQTHRTFVCANRLCRHQFEL